MRNTKYNTKIIQGYAWNKSAEKKKKIFLKILEDLTTDKYFSEPGTNKLPRLVKNLLETYSNQDELTGKLHITLATASQQKNMRHIRLGRQLGDFEKTF